MTKLAILATHVVGGFEYRVINSNLHADLIDKLILCDGEYEFSSVVVGFFEVSDENANWVYLELENIVVSLNGRSYRAAQEAVKGLYMEVKARENN